MGFYLRKSLRAGPFRFNLSKSGLGVSAGIPGFRVGAGPRGNYVHVGAHGVYYRATLGGKPGTRSAGHPPETQLWLPSAGSDILLEDTTGATPAQLLPTGADDLVKQLNDAGRRIPLWPFALLGTIVLTGALASPVGVVALTLGLASTVWLGLRDRARRSVVAFYEVDGAEAHWFGGLVESFTALGKASGLWRINASGHIRTTYQYKVNSGASDLVSRAVASAGLGGPRPLITNIAVPTLAAGRQALHFLPDRVLAREGKQFASFSYRALNASAKASRFIESARPPRDGQQVDVTWQYANVKGGPDRRFKNNRQLPIMLYGQIVLSTAGGLMWIIDCSQLSAAQAMTRCLQRVQPRGERANELPAQI